MSLVQTALASLPAPLAQHAASLLRFLTGNPNQSLLATVLRTGSVTLVAAILALALETARRKRRDLPTEAVFGHWIWGHAIALGWQSREKRYDWCLEASRMILDKHKTLTWYAAAPFMPPIIVSNDPRNVEWVLKTNFENYEKGPLFFENQKPLLGHGIFNADGDTWRIQRKTASYLFHVKNFRDFMLKVFADHTEDLTARIDAAAATGSVIDLYDLLHRFTLDAFMEIGFGTPVHSLRSDEQLPFAVAFDRAQAITSARMTMSPGQRILTEAVTGDARVLSQCVKVTDEFARNVIRQRRAQMADATSDTELPADLLSRFLNMKKTDGTGYSDVELRDVLMNFIIAGRDTTAQGLSWTFYLLSTHPEVLAKIRKEIADVLGDSVHLGATEQDYAALTRQMPYTKAVFFEALRLYPSVPMEIKAAVRSDKLPDGTKINPGDRVVWAPYVMGRLKEVWGPDAEQFKPERFLDEEGAFVQPNPFKYPTFNAGPRVCLGKDMATIEGMACLVTLVRNYDFEIVNRDEIVYKVALTLQMKNGLKIRATRRP